MIKKIRKGVRRIMDNTIEMINSIKDIKVKETIKCFVLIGVGVVCVTVGAYNLKTAAQVDTIRNAVYLQQLGGN